MSASKPSLNMLKRATSSNSIQSASSANKGGPPPSPRTARDTPLYFALKVINLKLVTGGPEKVDQLKNEVEILKTLDHRSIIKAYETFQRHDTKQLVIVMELCTGGDLYARMPYTEIQVAHVLKQVLSAVSYMHDRNIIHRYVLCECKSRVILNSLN